MPSPALDRGAKDASLPPPLVTSPHSIKISGYTHANAFLAAVHADRGMQNLDPRNGECYRRYLMDDMSDSAAAVNMCIT